MVVVYSPTRSFRQFVRNRSSPKVVNKQEVCKKRRCVVTNIRAVETTTSCGKTTNYDNKRAANKYKLAAKKKQRSVTTNTRLVKPTIGDKNKTMCDKNWWCGCENTVMKMTQWWAAAKNVVHSIASLNYHLYPKLHLFRATKLTIASWAIASSYSIYLIAYYI